MAACGCSLVRMRNHEMAEGSTYGKPATRPLTLYAFDPSLGRKLNNYMTINVAYEDLTPGSVGRKFAVIDYDISNDCYYEPVNLDHPFVLIRNASNRPRPIRASINRWSTRWPARHFAGSSLH
jgi:hypothetical protein